MNPPDGEFPFFDLNNLLGGLSGQDPWKAAADMASSIATDGKAEPNLEPVDRIAIEDLARVAELHLGSAAGILVPPSAKISAVTRSVWSRQSVDAYKPFFDRFGEALSQSVQAESQLVAEQDLSDEDPTADLTAQMMIQLFSALGPMLVSTSAGSMLGHLGQTALGQYELPIPRTSDEVLVVPTNIDASAEQWGVPRDELRLWVLFHELAAHSILSVPHVKARMDSLLIDFASAFQPNSERIANEFGSMTDLSRLPEMSEKLSNPDLILSMLRSPAHDLLIPQLDALVAAILGFVDHTVTATASPLVPSHDKIRDGFRSRWADTAPADRFIERLLGLEIDGGTLERGSQFIAGIEQRAGDAGLERLWTDDLDLPTPAEVDAPGLWLARIGFDSDGVAGPSDGLEAPDDLSGLDDL